MDGGSVSVATLAAALTRHLPQSPCPVCGGNARLPYGRGVRCAGFSLDAVVYCTREEHAGRLLLDLSTSPPAFKHRLGCACLCGAEHGNRAGTAPRSYRAPLAPESADLRSARHDIFAAALAALELRPEARADLTGRGLSPEYVASSLFRSVPRKGSDLEILKRKMNGRFGESALRACPGFTDKNGRLTFWSAVGARDGYIVPYVNESGLITGLQMKVLGGRYLTAHRARVADVYHVAGGPADDLYVTEGGLKAEVSARIGNLWVFGVPGQALRPEHIDVIARLGPIRVIVALDRESNRMTALARDRWLTALSCMGLRVFDALWEGTT